VGGYEGAVDGRGVPHGRGKGFTRTGTRYEGEWVEGKREGKGTLTIARYGRCVGDWKGDTLEGRGVYTWASGETYEGEFRGGAFDGSGTMVYASGMKYAGMWVKGVQNGQGVLTDKTGAILHKGQWIDGVVCVFGLVQFGPVLFSLVHFIVFLFWVYIT
jgi:hypothetical protein